MINCSEGDGIINASADRGQHMLHSCCCSADPSQADKDE